MSARFAYAAALVVFVTSTASFLDAQSSGQPGFTLHTSARVVLTDVSVTDANGNPIRGLPQSAFHVFDDKHPQQIASFEEHTGAQPAVMPTTEPSVTHTFSNDFLLHPPAAFNVIVLDTSSIEVVDQMYLYQELKHFLAALPPDQPLAIYIHGSDYTLLLQNFTTDRDLLLAALHKAIPRLPMAVSWPGTRFVEELKALQQITLSLAQLPGRKNVLWFGGASLFLRADATTLPASIDLRPLYDELETSRIALYPIDARGLTTSGDSWTHIQMDEEAHATGGRAFYNINGLAEISSKIITTDESFYTLSYSPRDFRQDNKWHQVSVKVDGGSYTLSYRTGYYGDGINAPVSKAERPILSSGGEKVHYLESRDSVEPIVFQADVEPSDSVPTPDRTPGATTSPVSEKKNETSYTIRYNVPVADFVQQSSPDGKRVQVGAGAIAFNQFGRPIGRLSQKITFTLDSDKLSKNPNANLYFDQQLSIPKGDDYLLVVLWDPATGRYGTIQAPIKVAKRVESSQEQNNSPRP